MAHQRKISVIGLGYVGLTVAVAFAQLQKVIGFDTNEARIADLKKYHDKNHEISKYLLQSAKIHYTTHAADLTEADFHIVTVPTPIDEHKHPDFSMLLEATKIVGKYLKKGDIVVYESTVYPGVTENKCIPVLESTSNLICNIDFKVGYSPERINPADKSHTFENIIKIVSATDAETLEIIADVYASVVKAGVHRVSSIRVAEAIKVVENTQRDLNISILNEMTTILHPLDINMSEVLAAMQTKWNCLPFHPGLVGGHCISTNAYHLVHVAQELGCHPDIILAGRRMNEYMSKFIAEETIKKLTNLHVPINKSRIGILGFSYKENYSGFHHSKVIDLIQELKSHQVEVIVHDPVADAEIVKKEHGIQLENLKSFTNLDAVILTVAHQQYLDLDKVKFIRNLGKCKLIVDLKGIVDQQQFADTGIIYWRL